MSSTCSDLTAWIAARWSSLPSNVNTFDRSGIAQLERGRSGNRIEHRLHVGRRFADDAQDLAGGGLLLERFGQRPVARLQLVEEPNVLDRDHGLIGKGLQQSDLLL